MPESAQALILGSELQMELRMYTVLTAAVYMNLRYTMRHPTMRSLPTGTLYFIFPHVKERQVLIYLNSLFMTRWEMS